MAANQATDIEDPLAQTRLIAPFLQQGKQGLIRERGIGIECLVRGTQWTAQPAGIIAAPVFRRAQERIRKCIGRIRIAEERGPVRLRKQQAKLGIDHCIECQIQCGR